MWSNQAARAAIQEVHRHHDVRPAKGRFVMTRAAEVNVVDLCPPDQANSPLAALQHMLLPRRGVTT